MRGFLGRSRALQLQRPRNTTGARQTRFTGTREREKLENVQNRFREPHGEALCHEKGLAGQHVAPGEHLASFSRGKDPCFARRQSQNGSTAGQGQCRQFQLWQTQWRPRANRREENMATSTLSRKVRIEARQCLTNAAVLREHVIRCGGQYSIAGAVARALRQQTCGGGKRG